MRVCIYTRVSSVKQAEKGSSIDNQTDQLRAYCVARGWEVVGEYTDQAVSGRTFSREGFNQMMNDLKPNSMVMVYSLSRFGRNTREFLKHLDLLTKKQVEFFSLDIGFDTSTAMGKAMLTIFSAFAQLESDQMSERITAVMGNKKSKGEIYCGRPPLGYRNQGDKLVEIPSEIQTLNHVRKIFNETGSYAKTAARLNRLGLRGKYGGKFQHSTVEKIITNNIYESINSRS